MKYFSLISLMNKTAPSNPLWDNLYAVYKAESNANDSLGVYNGTAQGGLTYSTGKDGNAFVFNGTNAYVELPNNCINFTDDFEIAFWMDLRGVNADSQQPISNGQRNAGGSTVFGYGIYIQNGIMNFQILDGLGGFVQLSYTISSYYSNWAFFQVQREWGVGSKIKINGTVVASNTSTMNPGYRSDVAHTPCIGVYKSTTGNNYYMKNGGKIDEVYFWDRLLTTDEDSELYNAGAGTYY